MGLRFSNVVGSPANQHLPFNMSSFGPCTRLSTIQKLCFPQEKRKSKIYCETKKNILSHKNLFLASFLKNS